MGKPYRRRIALTVEYDGTGYMGFQLQPARPTIQGELERALNRFTGEAIRVRGASRTDSGAHAWGQVVDFPTHSLHPVETFPRALNFYLPADIKIQTAHEMVEEFHSRRDASSRTYRYHILNRQWPSPIRRHNHYWVREALDVGEMAAAARWLVGSHDFRPLSSGHPKDKSAVRRVMRWEISRENDTIVVECEATGFLRRQIRQANALLVDVGRGKAPTTIIREILLEGRRTERLNRPSLPACGLHLVKVTYPNFWSQVRTEDETDQHLLSQDRRMPG